MHASAYADPLTERRSDTSIESDISFNDVGTA